jgi:phosphoribosylaminoimidazolecarboxamide formyltransferase/IMP cyclohydrolase
MVLASDAFFPFNDALELALDAGATAAVHPGGSRNDAEAVRLADARGAAMWHAGHRHFRH